MKPFRMQWVGMLAAIAVVANASLASAQTEAPASPRSTRAGVYSAEQAERGRITYAGMCRSCHSMASHTGATFETWWKGRTVADLFAYTSTQMPKNDPGSLADEDYVKAIAYLMRVNGMPAGETPLPADSASLSRIRFDSTRSVPTSTGPRR